MFRSKLKVAPDKLIRLFAITGLVTICVVSFLFGLFFLHFLRQHLLERDAVVSQDFVQSISQFHEPEQYFLEQELLGSGSQLELFYQYIVQMPDVIRANIYSAERVIIWSSDFELIGRHFDDNPHLEVALNSKLSFNWEEINELDKSEHVVFADDVSGFVEIYIPIWDSMRTEVLGAVEIYKRPDELLQVVAEGRWWFLLAMLLGGLLLYLALFWIVRYANGLIKQQQQSLWQAEKLAALGEISAMVSHGLRGALSNIRATAELAQTECGDAAAEMQTYMGDIISEVDRLDSRLRGLLTSVHEPEANLSRAGVKAVVSNSLNTCRQCIERAGVDVKQEIPKGLPDVRTNPEFLQYVLCDLIANALEAMPQGGILTIKAEQQDGFVAIRLIDTGVGVPPDQLAQVFRPLHSSKTNGLGVGLSLARRVIQRFGGKLELFSGGRNSGTTALLQLPVDR